MEKRKNPKLRKRTFLRNRFILGTVILLISVTVVFICLSSASKELPKISTEKFKHSASFKNHLIVYGIDVSAIQGRDIDWNKVKRSGVDFVILRAGYTDYRTGKLHKDIMFEQNYRDARKAGLMVGAYMFSQASSVKEAKHEAEFLVETVNNRELQMPLVMDYELMHGGKLEKALNKGKLDGKTSRIVDAFCTVVENAGYDSMLYGNYNFLTKTLDIKTNSTRTNIWLAHYTDKTDFDYPYSMWQSSDRAKIPGIKGGVDMDFWYVKPSACIKAPYSEDIKAKSLSSAEIVFSKENHTYMHLNKPVEPSVYVKHRINRLREGKDYSISYIKNSHEGTGYVVIKGKGKYKDTIIKSFKIRNFF